MSVRWRRLDKQRERELAAAVADLDLPFEKQDPVDIFDWKHRQLTGEPAPWAPDPKQPDAANARPWPPTRVTFYDAAGWRYVPSVAERLEAEGWTVIITIETDGPEDSCVPDVIRPYLTGSRPTGSTKPPPTFESTESDAFPQ